MTYIPNFSDARVLKRIWTAYAFTRAYVREGKSVPLPKALLEKSTAFGQGQHSLPAYLRETLLICTNNRYSMTSGEVKEYTLNVDGALFLRSVLINAGYLKGHASKLQGEGKSSSPLSLPALSKCITSFPEETGGQPSIPAGELFDKEVAVAWVEREYETELKTLTFDYEDKSSRLWHPLQNVRKPVRTEVLANAGLTWDYDIDACAPTLIHQHAVMNGMDEYLFGLMDYLNNKTDFRQHIASITGDLKIAKTLINALFCGARIGANRDFALFHLLKKDRAVIAALQKDERLNSLKADIKTCWAAIEPSLGRREAQDKNGHTRKVALSSKRKWGCYFDLERKVMTSVRRYLLSHGRRHFLIHDGWGCDEKLDRAELSAYVLQETGFNITFSEEEIVSTPVGSITL